MTKSDTCKGDLNQPTITQRGETMGIGSSHGSLAGEVGGTHTFC